MARVQLPLPADVASKDGTAVTLEGKRVGLYFSAHWCPPCRRFTPVLNARYEELLSGGEPFELIYCSSDSSQAEFDEYWGTMSFPAIPYAKRAVISKLAKVCGISGIPALYIFEGDGTLVTMNGRELITRVKPSEMAVGMAAPARRVGGWSERLHCVQNAGCSLPIACATAIPAAVFAYYAGERLAQKTEIVLADSLFDGELPSGWMPMLNAEYTWWILVACCAVYSSVYYATANTLLLRPMGYFLPIVAAIVFSCYSEIKFEESSVVVRHQAEHVRNSAAIFYVFFPVAATLLTRLVRGKARKAKTKMR